VLSNFAHVRWPDLLRTLLGETAATVPAVLVELREGEILGRVPRQDWRWLSLIEPVETDIRLREQFRQRVGAGEAECLAVAVTRRYQFLSDDAAARRLARREGLTVSGTLGILQKLVEGAYFTGTEADQLLAIMISQGYRSPVQSLQEL
jgi:predicted nucleic acid-binding protein